MRLSAAVRGGEHRTAESLLRGSGAAVVLSCLLSYAVLAAGDSLSNTSASRASLVALGLAAAILIGLAVLTLGPTRRPPRAPLAAGDYRGHLRGPGR